MADITLGNLIALILEEVSDTLDQKSSDTTAGTNLEVTDVYFDIPAHLYLQTDGQFLNQEETTSRVMISLPSTLETPPVGKLGRIRMTIAPEKSL
ncbi:MAG: hypothetical protein F6J94_02180 [Moorea sp. SIO1F2]|uniref:hypothetical protein n=1 Tax=Moorena sp. SIO1F2 TaxID=2607819 RepID=UPI0013B874AB|nr:hypothetical protein [Moorena sp. SIO1F2]NET80824.1 hypothetical protein [Moorena sp. SIO1F2]